MQLGFDLAGNRGAVLDNLCTGSREETRQFLCFRGDIDASQATVREINGQFLGIATIRLDLIVGCHRDGRRIDDNVGDTRFGEGAVQHEG